jgi:hypothetical protein
MRFLAAALIVPALVLGAVAWRLAEAPLDIDFLIPTIDRYLSQPDGGRTVHVGAASLFWSREAMTLEIVARDVRATDREGGFLAALPTAALDIDLLGSLRGRRLVLKRLVLDQPRLRLVRESDGSFRYGVGEDQATAGTASPTPQHDLATVLLQQIRGADDGLLAPVSTVVVRHAGLTLVDRGSGTIWDAPDAALLLRRNAAGLFAAADVAIQRPGRPAASVRAELRHDRAADRVTGTLAFSDLQVDGFAALGGDLAMLSGVQVPIDGNVRLAMDAASLHVTAAELELAAGGGRIVHPELPDGSIAVAGSKLRASYEPATERLTVFGLDLDLGGPTVAASATVDGVSADRLLRGVLPDEIAVAADAVLRDVPANSLPHLWPAKVGVSAREWVLENIRDGAAEETKVATRLRVRRSPADPAAAPAVVLDAFNGTIRYRNLTVNYLRPLPPVRGVSGTGSFTRSRFDFVPMTGNIAGVRITGATVSMTRLDTNDEQFAIDFGVAGPLRDVLETINVKPFEYAREIGIDPAKVTGAAEARLSFRFPLARTLTFEQVDLSVRAQLSAVGVGRYLFKQDLTDGGFDLLIDRISLRLTGGAKLGSALGAVTATHQFKAGKDGVTTRATVRMSVDDEARRRFELDWLNPYVAGPVGLETTFTGTVSKRNEALIVVDFKDAALSVPQLNWSKPAASPSAGRIELELNDDRPVRLRDVLMHGSGLDVQGTVAFAPDGRSVQRAEMRRLVVGSTSVSGTATRRADGTWLADLDGASLDVSGLLKGGPDKEQPSTAPPVIANAHLGRVLLGPGREARNVTARLESNGPHWQSARIEAGLAAGSGGGQMSFRLGQAGGDRGFNFSTNNFGEVVRLLDISNNIQGGQLVISGQAEDEGAKRRFRGRAEGSDYRLIQAPAFARLLGIASFSGIAALLSGEGIPFSRLYGNFVYGDDIVTLRGIRAYGGAIGITASGTVDLGKETLDLEGTLVPAYALNTILGNIPVIGNLLMGGEGQGLFGANFHAAGPFSDPKINVNPLSALAPGFLRNLFLFDAGTPGSGGNASDTSPPAEKAQP